MENWVHKPGSGKWCEDATTSQKVIGALFPLYAMKLKQDKYKKGTSMVSLLSLALGIAVLLVLVVGLLLFRS